MTRMFNFLKNPHTISALGFLLVASVLYLAGLLFDVRTQWIVMSFVLCMLIWGAYWVMRWRASRKASLAMDTMFQDHVSEAVKLAPADKKDDVHMLRQRLLEAIHTIKTSKLGQTTGSAALYEMPWYIVIGNPAAGKSTAILNSGLNFPFSDKSGRAVQGIGGTRNCDWFFTTEGILLDTAGRYAVQEEDRDEWFGFLGLLKKYRPKAPINGIVIVASIAELSANRPDATIMLAKQLRQRVQELTERLALFAPVYVVFTKVDLIAGFADFFEDADEDERGRVWGATLPYDASQTANAVTLFDQHFKHLSDGLREMATNRMSLNRGHATSPGTLTFPVEFQGVRQQLRTFLATLFEDNPFQFKPVFRGFYFTSAIQEGVGTPTTSQRLMQQYGLSTGRRLTATISSNTGFFLKNLFSAVIFADRNLVRQYASRRKLLLRQVGFYGGALTLGLLIAVWGWSFTANRQYLANIRADLDKAAKIQETRVDLASRLEALELLQDRLEQLQRYRVSKPLSLGFGLYQGERYENKLRSEYFKGLQQLMLIPVTAALERFLTDVAAGNLKTDAGVTQNAKPDAGAFANTLPPLSDGRSRKLIIPYQELSPANPENAYNALKTYLMLANRDRVDTGHLGDQITRFWRNWLEANRGNASREQVIRSAEKILSFYLAQAAKPDFPLIENKLALVDQSRDTLRSVIKGTPARARVYGEIKMRASTRFPNITVASIVGYSGKDFIAGSHAISGAFTREAWEQFIEGAIRDASTKELRSADWVLKTAASDDLSLEGSPEQIRRDLLRMYKTEYIAEWKKFMQGVTIPEFTSFDRAVHSMNHLGDPESSPLNALLQMLYRQTSWDNPSAMNLGMQNAKSDILQWIRTTILRQAPSQVNIKLEGAPTKPAEAQTGTIGKEFAAIGRLVEIRQENGGTTIMAGYLTQLSKIRSRFNQIKNSGDVGPASKQLMQATLDGNGSELADGLKYIDESMLTGMPDSERGTVRPLLVRPLMQAYSVLITPSELELNRNWSAQVFDHYSRSLASKYPFSTESRVEAAPAEITQVFGNAGAIAKFVQSTLGPLVIRRGDTVSARTWADMGIRLNPAFLNNLPRYVGIQGQTAVGAMNTGAPTTQFQFQPVSSPGIVEYTVDIDGQTMRYRNGQQDWVSFVWPSPQGLPGARISAVTVDGKALEIANFQGQFGLEKLINAAQRRKLDNGSFVMSWSAANHTVSLNFKLISDSRTGTGTATSGTDNTLRGLTLPAVIAGTAPALRGSL